MEFTNADEAASAGMACVFELYEGTAMLRKNSIWNLVR